MRASKKATKKKPAEKKTAEKKPVEKIPIDRSMYLRVTKILAVIRTGLDDFLERGGERARATVFEKAEYGQQVHAMCDKFNKAFIDGKILPIEDVIEDFYFEEANFAFAKYRTWVLENVEAVIESEMEIYNDDYKYWGHLDVVVKMKGDAFFSILDIKTPETPSRTWYLQCEAYRRAYNYKYKSEVAKRGFALIVSPDEKCKVKESSDPKDKLFSNFLYAMSLKIYMNPKGERK